MQQAVTSSVWLSSYDSQSFSIMKLLLRCLSIGLLSFTHTYLLPQKVEASAITNLKPAKRRVEAKIAEAAIVEQPQQLIPHSTEQQEPQQLKLKLQDAVVLALQNNRILENAYLQRIIDLEDLEQAEAKFVPELIPQASVSFRRNEAGIFDNTEEELELGTSVFVIIPTGAQIRMDLTGAGQIQDSSTSSENFLRQNFSVSVNQPLLRNFGSAIATASIKIARLDERQNQLQLKSILIETITNAVFDYRDLVQAQEELKIQQQALTSAKRQLEITQAFIDAGRQARVDLIPSQTAVANREVELLAAKNRLQEAQLQLLQTLDLKQNIEPIALETPKVVEPNLPSFTKILELAFDNNPNYLITFLDTEIAELFLALAENDKLWNLDLNVSYDKDLNSISEDSSDFASSLNLNREFFGDRNLEREAIRSKILLQQTLNALAESKATLEIQVQNSIREVNFRLTEVVQARQATQLSRQQLEIEREKLRLGRGSIIDVIRFEEDLVNAANRELNAVIAYLNALTSLEQTIGTTLETWNVKVEER